MLVRGGELASPRQHFPLNLVEGGAAILIVIGVLPRIRRSALDLSGPRSFHVSLGFIEAREQLCRELGAISSGKRQRLLEQPLCIRRHSFILSVQGVTQ